jgi:hypothetical protein
VIQKSFVVVVCQPVRPFVRRLQVFRSLIGTYKIVYEGVLLLLLLLLLLLTAIELSLGGSSPYTSTNRADKNKYT